MNLPNQLTLLRVVLVPVTVVFLLFPRIFGMGENAALWARLAAAAAFSLTALTDMLDGKIARKYHLITNFGKFMDPLADKFLVNSSLILLAVYKSNLLPAIIVILMIGRDLAVDGMRFIASSKGEVIAANIYGKLKTVVQMVVIPVIFLNGFPFNYLLKEYTFILTIVFASIALFFSLLSGIIYIYRGRKFLKD